MREISYYANNQSTNACIDNYSNNNARKTLEGKPALAIPMHLIVMQLNPCSEKGWAACNKCSSREKTPDSIARNDIIFGSQFVNLCVPFFNAENEIFIFCQFAN